MGSESRMTHADAFAAAKAIFKRRELNKQRETDRRDTRYRAEYDRDPRRPVDTRPPPTPSVYQRPQRELYRDTAPQQTDRRRIDYPQPVSQPRENAPRYSYQNMRNAQPTSAYNNTTRDRQRDEYRPQQRIQIKSCQYCRRSGHDISECRKREYNDNVARRNVTGNLPGPSGHRDAAPVANPKEKRPINQIVIEKETKDPESNTE
ncbi:hypothetical protein ALC62_12625 [Cyphomyrmex costatus]|uniref:Uncharacterized protein n=1 Tax=Cyphomyrmex costatus TaxID=456900 RepID=A0A151IAY4_9HYME|nr:hypothetical protein ALC62_12625 [Cyphomyrmex costatus]